MFYFSRLRVSIVYMLIVFPSCFLIATTNAAFMCSSSQYILKKYYVILSQDPDRMQCLLLILWNWTELYSVWEHLSFVTYVSSFGSCLLSSLFHFSCPVCLCLVSVSCLHLSDLCFVLFLPSLSCLHHCLFPSWLNQMKNWIYFFSSYTRSWIFMSHHNLNTSQYLIAPTEHFPLRLHPICGSWVFKRRTGNSCHAISCQDPCLVEPIPNLDSGNRPSFYV